MSDLFAAVAHDVKNQLAELALRLEARGGAEQEMVIALDAARRLSEILLLFRQESNLLSVNMKAVSAADFLTVMAAEYRALFPQLAFETSTEQAPAFSFFDDALVRMAFANALHNACRFARSRIKLSAYEKNRMLVLEVSDDGAGYPESLLLNGGAYPSTVSDRGTGLGLYLANKIAGLHCLEGRCGCIELSNVDGAVFRMMLP